MTGQGTDQPLIPGLARSPNNADYMQIFPLKFTINCVVSQWAGLGVHIH